MDAPSKLLFVDIETTGIDPKRHCITQIACVARLEDPIHHGSAFSRKMRPHDGADVSPGALTATKVQYDELMSRMPQEQAFKDFVEYLGNYVDRFKREDKFVFVAFNSRFDEDFVREWFLRNGDKYYGSWFWTPSLCVMQKAMDLLKHERNRIPGFKQSMVAEYLGIKFELEGLHDAEADVQLCEKIYDELEKRELGR